MIKLDLIKETTIDILKAFVNSKRRNEWLSVPHGQIYVRKGFHLVRGQYRATFDIANVGVWNDERQQGIYTAYRLAVESFEFPVFVENIQASWLIESHLKSGYELVNPSHSGEPIEGSISCFKDGTDAEWTLPSVNFGIKKIVKQDVK